MLMTMVQRWPATFYPAEKIVPSPPPELTPDHPARPIPQLEGGYIQAQALGFLAQALSFLAPAVRFAR